MTTKRLAYLTPRGVEVFTPNPRNRLPGETEDAFLARVIARLIECAGQIRKDGRIVNPLLTKPDDVSIVDVTDLPKDRGFREAWKLEGGKIALDPVKAQAIEARKALRP